MKRTSPALKQKAQRAQYALAHYVGRPLNSVQDEATVADLITDLLHFAASRNFDARAIHATAESAFYQQRSKELNVWDKFKP